MTNSADSAIRTKGSLCSGVGGLDAAVPGELAWVSETNEHASAVLKREHPGAPNLGDITAPGFSPTRVDLLTSGDPCQSMSVAGRQRASEDDRFLWPDVMGVVDLLRPRHLLLENVQNVTSVALLPGADDWRGEKGSVLKLRLDNLREAGYAVKWTVFGACAIGAPHHRHRWFLRATHVGGLAPAAVRIVNRCGAPRTGGRALLPTPAATRGGYNQGGAAGRIGPKRYGLDMVESLLPTPRATDIGTPGRRSSEGWRPQLGQAVAESWGKFAAAVALWEEITGMPAPEPTEPNSRGGRRLNPELSEWMMGYPRGYLTGMLARNDALRCAGNGVVTRQARAAWEMLA